MPREVDILSPTQTMATRLAQWEEQLDAVVPTKAAGANLLVATWNLRAFGDLIKAWKTGEGISPKRNFADIHAIAHSGRSPRSSDASTWSPCRKSAATCVPCATC
ncbi:hypothetical protein [Streptomyces chartreusis]|uniref:hypothetical protein n=1 Tax=Streptomyces chartreusis TaxID=1969 RepID=UPI002E8157DB|nr:hypothetical protein [Streptomyces chartreusis]WUB15252.1 hypothetical protein OG997_00455 [Streptomyces chartreusis]